MLRQMRAGTAHYCYDGRLLTYFIVQKGYHLTFQPGV